MKIRLYFEKENLIRLAVAMVFAAVMFAVIRFPVWVLFGFGVLYFGIKSLKIELNEKLSWLWSAIMLGTGGIFTAYHIQYLLLDAELRAKISDNKMLLNVLCFNNDSIFCVSLSVFCPKSFLYKKKCHNNFS